VDYSLQTAAFEATGYRPEILTHRRQHPERLQAGVTGLPDFGVGSPAASSIPRKINSATNTWVVLSAALWDGSSIPANLNSAVQQRNNYQLIGVAPAGVEEIYRTWISIPRLFAEGTVERRGNLEHTMIARLKRGQTLTRRRAS
jgi:hypothetical protein